MKTKKRAKPIKKPATAKPSTQLNILNLIKSSFKSIYKNPTLVGLSVLVDFIFLMVFTSIIGLFQLLALEHLTKLMEIVGQQTGGLSNIYNQTLLPAVSKGALSLSNNAEYLLHVRAIAKYIGLMIIVGYICWCIFEGISWYIAYKISTKTLKKNKKEQTQSFWQYWKNFWIESITFYALTMFIVFASVKAMLTIKTSITPIISETFMNAIFVILALAVWYFGFLTYSITNRRAYQNFKQSFIYGIKKFPKTIQSFGTIAVLLVIIDLILRIPFLRTNKFVMMFIGIILLLPTFVFARVLLFKTINSIRS